MLEGGAVAHVDAVWTPGSGGTRLVARGAEQTGQTLAIAENSVTVAAGTVLRTSPITIRAEEAWHELHITLT